MSETPEDDVDRARDRFFAPLLRDDDAPHASDRARQEGRKVTGTGVPTDTPADESTESRSELEGPPDDDFAPEPGEDGR